MVFAGDFRQTLPVVQQGTPADELNACLKVSYLWRHIQKRTLATNIYWDILLPKSLKKTTTMPWR